jgi:hypothetical protein
MVDALLMRDSAAACDSFLKNCPAEVCVNMLQKLLENHVDVLAKAVVANEGAQAAAIKKLVEGNAFADNMIEKFIERDSEEACKAFFENADVETNRAIIEKLWEADPDKFILAVVENLPDDVIDFERGGRKFKVKITPGKSIQTTRHMIRSST